MRSLLFSLFIIVACALPATSHAQTVPTSCAIDAVFVPYVYDDGVLHSFDVFIESGAPLDTGVVTVGSHTLDPRLTTTWDIGGGFEKVHVDVPSWYNLSGEIQIYLAVSHETCQNDYNFTVHLPKKAEYVPIVSIETLSKPATSGGSYETSPPEETGNTTQSVDKGGDMLTLALSCTDNVISASWAPVAGAESYVLEKTVSDSTFLAVKVLGATSASYDYTWTGDDLNQSYRLRAFAKGSFIATSEAVMCKGKGGAAGTIAPPVPRETCGPLPALGWIGLLVVQITLSLLTIDLSRMLLSGNGWRFVLALFIPFASLLGLWFFLDLCRLNQWFPIAVTIITLLTLFAPTFWNNKPSYLIRS